MNLNDLIQKLQDIADEYEYEGQDIDVRLAFQPSWPLQYEVGDVVAIDMNEPDEDDIPTSEDLAAMTPEEREEYRQSELNRESKIVVWIGEGGPTDDSPYVPGAAARELGWGRGR